MRGTLPKPPQTNRTLDGPLFLLPFSDEFADPVATGAKRQTGRVERADGRVPAVGQRLRAYAGLRRPGARWLMDGRCTHVWLARLTTKNILLGPSALQGLRQVHEGNPWHTLALADGFRNYDAMVRWFTRTHRKRLQAEGDLKLHFIRWEPIVLSKEVPR